MKIRIFRAAIFHTPRNPFREVRALEFFGDGGLVVDQGRISALGDFADLRKQYPEAAVEDWRGDFILPGFVDTHVHFPQVRILGALGEPLLEWLQHSALPEEARMADPLYAAAIAGEFLGALAAHGTTSALVFGAHFPNAMEVFFDAAGRSGLRIATGLVVSDRCLLPQLHVSPEEAYRQSEALIRRYHGQGELVYAVTPRFALSASEGMLEVCQTLMREHAGLLFTSHLNENLAEVEVVRRLFPGCADYLSVYEKFGLVGLRSVLAHNVHGTDAELERIATRGATVSHCPASNASLGSGIFPMARHLNYGVKLALGTDVGAGTGFGMLKEALQAYLMQRLADYGSNLTPAHLLYLATRAGAEALGFADAGDFRPGHSADFVHLRAKPGGVLHAVLQNCEIGEKALAALFTLAGPESVAGTWVRGRAVFGEGAR